MMANSNLEADSGTSDADSEKVISVDDMKLLITAVITFNSKQIVSAFLNVTRLKEELVAEMSKLEHNTDSTDFSMSDNLQTMFLRPTTPADDPIQLAHTSSRAPTNDVIACSKSGTDTRNSGVDTDCSVVAVKSRAPPTTIMMSSPYSNLNRLLSNRDNNRSSNSTLTDLIREDRSSTSYTTSTQPIQGKKCDNLDKLLRRHLSHTSSTNEPKTQLHAICTMKVSEAVASKTSSVIPRHPVPMMSEHLKPRKRKSTAPRYIPWPSQGKRAPIISDTSPLTSPSVTMTSTEPSPGYKTAGTIPESSSSTSSLPLLENLLMDNSTKTSTALSTNHPMTSAVSEPTLTYPLMSNADKEVIEVLPTGQSTQSTTESTTQGEGQTKDTEAMIACGPFVTNSQSELLPSANLGPEFQLNDTDFSENLLLNDSIDLSNILAPDQSLGSIANELAPFSDLSGFHAPSMRVAPSVVATPTTKIRKKRRVPRGRPAGPLGHTLNVGTGVGGAGDDKSNIVSHRMRCRRCNARFTSRDEYQQHLKSQICATGYTQTHTCQFCGYCALTRQRLIVHQRTHSGERPHRCPFCSYAATQQAPLKRHIQNIHMKEGAISLKSGLKQGDVPVNT